MASRGNAATRQVFSGFAVRANVAEGSPDEGSALCQIRHSAGLVRVLEEDLQDYCELRPAARGFLDC